MSKITVHNYLKILYNIAVQIDFEGGSEECRKERIRKIYVDRVLNDYISDDIGRDNMLSLLNDSIEDFMRLYYRHLPTPTEKCCGCFS